MMCIARKMANKKNLDNSTMVKKETQQAVPQEQAASVKSESKKATKSTSKKEESTPAPVQAAPAPVATAPATVKRIIKSASAKKEQAAPAPVQAAPVATPAPQESAPKAKAPKAKSAKAPVAQQSAPVVTQQAATTESETSQEPMGVSAIFESVSSQIENLINSQKALQVNVKRALKMYQKEAKEAEKSQEREKRRHRKDPNRKKREPTGFAVASSISDSLCSFLGVAAGTKLSRTDVTRKVTAYIRENNLQVPSNKRCFVPDTKLSAVLGPLKPVDQGKGYNYFNLQRYITPHFPSTKKAVSAQ